MHYIYFECTLRYTHIYSLSFIRPANVHWNYLFTFTTIFKGFIKIQKQNIYVTRYLWCDNNTIHFFYYSALKYFLMVHLREKITFFIFILSETHYDQYTIQVCTHICICFSVYKNEFYLLKTYANNSIPYSDY